jgi:hypothetical protein
MFSLLGLRKSEPEDKCKLEDVVEGEPVRGTDCALDDSEESVNNPVSQPLSVISLSSREEGVKGVVGGENEASEVDEQLTGNIKEDQEGVDTAQTKDNVDLGDRGLALKVVKDRVLGELYTEIDSLALVLIRS